MNNRNLFLTVMEAGNSKIKVLAGSVPGESCFLADEIFLCSHGRNDGWSVSGLFYKDIHPIHKSPLS